VDLVVVADRLGATLLERLEQLGPRPGRVEPFAWSAEEWRARLASGDPMAVEAVATGTWLVGSPRR